MNPNPFLRGYDKLSIQLLVQDLQPGGSLQALSYVIHAKDRDHAGSGCTTPLEQGQQIVERLTFSTGHSAAAGNQYGAFTGGRRGRFFQPRLYR